MFAASLHGVLILLLLGSVTGYIWDRHRDATQRQQFADSLIAAEAGRWFWDLKTDTVTWDDQMFVLYGISREHFRKDYHAFLTALHPEDRPTVEGYCKQAIATRGSYQALFRVIDDVGNIRRIRAAGKVAEDGSYMTGICLPAFPPDLMPPDFWAWYLQHPGDAVIKRLLAEWNLEVPLALP